MWNDHLLIENRVILMVKKRRFIYQTFLYMSMISKMFLFIFMNVDEDKKQENQVWLAHILLAMPTVAAAIIVPLTASTLFVVVVVILY